MSKLSPASLSYGKKTAMRSEASILEEIALREKIHREKVSPKLEAFRKPARIKGCRGGRGAGAKSWSIASLLIQAANFNRKHVVCLREVQLTLEESVWKLMGETIERLQYPGWVITKEYIDCPRTGSHIIFRGLSDLRADQVKSLEAFDIAWIEEAQSVSDHSLDVLFPTIRAPGSEIWFSMNPDEELDPIVSRTWGTNRADMILLDLEPGPKDNPWWTAELQAEMDEDFRRDPELAEHVWNGAPRIQGERAVFKRKDIRAAMDRDVEPEGVVQLGIDVARFGDDRSVIYKRCGMTVLDMQVFNGADTQEVARRAWDIAERDPSVKIKVDDDGVGGGVTDKLRDMGADVVPVHNGGKPSDSKLYTSCADEQWFSFPMGRADIPDDPELMAELSARQYKYTPDDRRKIESKADFKKRYGRSPDKADALLLAFYDPPDNRFRWGPA
jgi:phage terminase large subunit